MIEWLHGRVPILQAPMAGVATPALAAAVSGAGAIGGLGLGASPVEAARKMIREARALGCDRLHVNLFCHEKPLRDDTVETAWLDHLRPHFEAVGAVPPVELTEIYPTFRDDDAMLPMLLEEHPEIVSFHFGLPRGPQIDALRSSGAILLGGATNAAEAQQVGAAGLDGIIAQGWQAGGHRGCFDPAAADEKLATCALVRAVRGVSPLPVIAAGGLMKGRDIREAQAAGAVAFQLGTAFLACPESGTSAGWRRALTEPSDPTVVTSVISGRPARGLSNRATRIGGQVPVPAYPVAYDAAKALNAAARAAGEDGYGAWWAGTGHAQARDAPAAEIVRSLAAEIAAA